MRLHPALRARNPASAAQAWSWALTVVSVLCVFSLFVDGSVAVPPVVVLASAVGTGALAVVCRILPADLIDRTGALLGLVLLGVGLISAIVISAGQPAPAAGMVFALGALMPAAHLRSAGAWVATAATWVAFAAAGSTVDPPVEALTTTVVLVAVTSVTTLVLSRALDQQAALTKKLTDIASLDSLTGLATRRAFDEAVDIALAGHAEEKGTALILVDLDTFKTINDEHGHPVGDRALQHISAILSGSVRARDSVVGRLGGDELAVLLAGCPVDVAERRARDLWEAVRNSPLELADGTSLPLTVSVGVAHAPPSGRCAGELYAAADGALYAAKRGGRDAVAVAG